MISALSGLCLGYDTSVIAGASLYYTDAIPMSDFGNEMIVSAAIIGGAIGSLTSGYFADKFGRKPTILVGDVFMLTGAGLMAGCWSYGSLFVGRLFAGYGFGSELMSCGVYLAEMAPHKIRGSIIGANIAFLVFGQFLAIVICILVAPNWRLMLGLGGVPAILQGVLCAFVLPESPYYLMRVNKDEQAIKVVRNSFKEKHGEAANLEVEVISAAFEDEQTRNPLSFSEAFREIKNYYGRNLAIACAVHSCQQLCGINTVMYYGPYILEDAGFGDDENKLSLLIDTLPLSLMSTIGACLGIYYAERSGRRGSMLIATPCIALTMIGLSLTMYLIYY